MLAQNYQYYSTPVLRCNIFRWVASGEGRVASGKWQNEVIPGWWLVRFHWLDCIKESNDDVTCHQLLDGGHHIDCIGLNERNNRQKQLYISENGGIPPTRNRSCFASIGLT